MKYWRGYLVALIFAVINWGMVQFAKAHSVLIDMVYPYMTRMVVTSMARWTGDMPFCLWQVLLMVMIVIGIVTVIFMFLFRWNFVQWLGWVLATVSLVSLLQTGIYDLNRYASPLADDVRLEVTDYTVAELTETTIYFRDKANELAAQVKRKKNGQVDTVSFKEMAEQAGEGFRVLAYDEAISVFAGSTVPVKKLTWSSFYKGEFGVAVQLTGEAAVNPDIPGAVMPFAMCNVMARRMSIYSDADAAFAAFLACRANPDVNFQYAAYLLAYHYCYTALNRVPTNAAQASAKQADQGVSNKLRTDLTAYRNYFGKNSMAVNNRAAVPDELAREDAPIRYSRYSDVSDLLVSWYIQNYIAPLHVEEETPFDPLDPNQVDLSGLVNAKPKK